MDAQIMKSCTSKMDPYIKVTASWTRHESGTAGAKIRATQSMRKRTGCVFPWVKMGRGGRGEAGGTGAWEKITGTTRFWRVETTGGGRRDGKSGSTCHANRRPIEGAQKREYQRHRTSGGSLDSACHVGLWRETLGGGKFE